MHNFRFRSRPFFRTLVNKGPFILGNKRSTRGLKAIPWDALASESNIERNRAIIVCHDKKEETNCRKSRVRETVTVFLVENGEESQLKNLRVFLKQTATPPPPDLLLFIIACFIPLKSNSSVKTISTSADKDFSPLSRYLFIKNVNKYENRLYKLLIQLKHCTELFLGDL